MSSSLPSDPPPGMIRPDPRPRARDDDPATLRRLLRAPADVRGAAASVPCPECDDAGLCPRCLAVAARLQEAVRAAQRGSA